MTELTPKTPRTWFSDDAGKLSSMWLMSFCALLVVALLAFIMVMGWGSSDKTELKNKGVM